MWLFFETFLLVFLTDVLYTYYVRALNGTNALVASSWSAVVTVCASMVAINSVEDHTMLGAVLLGAFCGTYVGMKYRKEK
jgi:hypothetical protein